jgi:hypothetical protein
MSNHPEYTGESDTIVSNLGADNTPVAVEDDSTYRTDCAFVGKCHTMDVAGCSDYCDEFMTQEDVIINQKLAVIGHCNCGWNGDGLCPDCQKVAGTLDVSEDGIIANQKPVAVEGAPTMQEVDAAIYGTRDEPVKADDDLLADKPKAAKKPRKAKAKVSPEQKQIEANMWEAVKFAWGLTENSTWKIVKLRKFLLGTVKNSKADKRYGDEWKLCQLSEQPATAQEVVAFSHWYSAKYDGMTMPSKGTTLLDHIQTFRAQDNYDGYMRKATQTIRDNIPGITSPGIELEREQVTAAEDEEKIEVTPELLADIKTMMDSIGKGGV